MKRGQAPAAGDLERAILATVGRRPLTAKDISLSLGRHMDEVLKPLSALLERKEVRRVDHAGKAYFARARG